MLAKLATSSIRIKEYDGVVFFRNGGWILDNFPRTRDQWAAATEKGLIPDDVICLRDSSDNGRFLLKRWYEMNKEEIDNAFQLRKAQETQAKR